MYIVHANRWIYLAKFFASSGCFVGMSVRIWLSFSKVMLFDSPRRLFSVSAFNHRNFNKYRSIPYVVFNIISFLAWINSSLYSSSPKWLSSESNRTKTKLHLYFLVGFTISSCSNVFGPLQNVLKQFVLSVATKFKALLFVYRHTNTDRRVKKNRRV